MLKTHIHWIIAAAALLAAALLADAWQSARHNSAQLASTIASQNIVIEHAAQNEKQRNAQLADALASIAAKKSAVRTPRQAAGAIVSVLPQLPLPVSIQFPNLTATTISPGDPAENSPDNSPAIISIPQPDLKPIYDDLQDCRASQLESAALKNDLADEKSRNTALTEQRDAALTAVHGGTFWTRLKREARWFAIGIAIGAAATGMGRR